MFENQNFNRGTFRRSEYRPDTKLAVSDNIKHEYYSASAMGISAGRLAATTVYGQGTTDYSRPTTTNADGNLVYFEETEADEIIRASEMSQRHPYFELRDENEDPGPNP